MSGKIILLFAILLLAAGCGKKGESVAKTAGNKVGETITDFATGIGKGIDKQMTVNVELSDELVKKGLEKTVAKSTGLDSPREKGISVYFIAKLPFDAKLIAKAINKEGQEIGRSVVDVELSADDAKYVTFMFAPEMDTQLVDKYLISLKN